MKYSIINYTHHAVYYILWDFILYLEAYTFWPSSPISPTFYFWEPSICSLYLWAFKKKKKNYFTYKEDHTMFVFLCVPYFT